MRALYKRNPRKRRRKNVEYNNIISRGRWRRATNSCSMVVVGENLVLRVPI
jgi:hypothetical protein